MYIIIMQVILMIKTQLLGIVFSLKEQLLPGVININKFCPPQYQKLSIWLWVMKQKKKFKFKNFKQIASKTSYQKDRSVKNQQNEPDLDKKSRESQFYEAY